MIEPPSLDFKGGHFYFWLQDVGTLGSTAWAPALCPVSPQVTDRIPYASALLALQYVILQGRQSLWP